MPFYVGMANSNHWDSLRLCTQASFGDSLITVLAYLLALIFSGHGALGVFKNKIIGWSVYLGSGLLITIGLEIAATSYFGRWQYSELMPVLPILNVGLVPIVQWLVLPPVILCLSWVLVRGLKTEI